MKNFYPSQLNQRAFRRSRVTVRVAFLVSNWRNFKFGKSCIWCFLLAKLSRKIAKTTRQPCQLATICWLHSARMLNIVTFARCTKEKHSISTWLFLPNGHMFRKNFSEILETIETLDNPKYFLWFSLLISYHKITGFYLVFSAAMHP